jgi:hypothetical protein
MRQLQHLTEQNVRSAKNIKSTSKPQTKIIYIQYILIITNNKYDKNLYNNL